MLILKLVGVIIVLYPLVVFFLCLSEITYHKRKPKDVFGDIKKIMIKALVGMLVVSVFSIVYYILGIEFKE